MNQQENSPWQYKPDDGAESKMAPQDGADQATPRATTPTALAWQAAEFVEHQHTAGWYMALLIVTITLAALVYLTTKEYIAVATILVLGVIVGIFAGHKPKLVNYEISSDGLGVNGKVYPYGSFKSFSILREGPLSSVNLLPLKRFMPPVSAYFDPKDEQKVVDVLGNFLPYEERKLESIDRLARRLRL